MTHLRWNPTRSVALVQNLIATINEDDTISAKFSNKGDGGGLLTRKEHRAFYTFQIEFFNKATNASQGVAILNLNATEPRHVSPFGYDIGTQQGLMDTIHNLVRQAAESKQKPQAPRPSRFTRSGNSF